MSDTELPLPFEAYKGSKPYLFVSYALSDSDLVYPELIRMKSMGFEIWYDEGNDHCLEWPAETENALKEAAVFLFFVSPDSVRSTNCRAEVYFAKEHKKPSFTIYLQDTNVSRINAGLALNMSNLHALLKFQLDDEEYDKKLQIALELLLQGDLEGAERILVDEDIKEWKNLLGMKFAPAGTPGVLFSVWLTRVRDYDSYVKMTKQWGPNRPSFSQGPTHPIVCVSHSDAENFCRWLTTLETESGLLESGKEYRLPTHEEWNVAVGLDSKKPLKKKEYPWGSGYPPPPETGNYQRTGDGGTYSDIEDGDGFEYTSPVGSFPPNKHGLYDMGGNVWEWCQEGGLRGGSFCTCGIERLSSAYRLEGCGPSVEFGFRCVLAKKTKARSSR